MLTEFLTLHSLTLDVIAEQPSGYLEEHNPIATFFEKAKDSQVFLQTDQ